jgi:hypothetical protein
MSTATWSTALIPAHALAAGDRIDVNGDDVTITEVITNRATMMFGSDTHIIETNHDYAVTVHVPDEPVDGYGLWKPKPGVWPSGCVCLIRANPKMPGNWETVVRDETCRGHYDWNDYED